MPTEARGAPGPVRLRAHAKLNLTLRVLAREESGYHSIETLLLRLSIADEIELEATGSPGVDLEVVGDPEVPSNEANLCWQAARAFAREVGSEGGVRIRLRKDIPPGAGLGGGSADAAAVLRGLNRLAGGPLDDAALARLAGDLGSDVPFGLCAAHMALAWERGRRLLPLEAPRALPVLIVVPDFPVAAGQAYAWLAADRAAGEGSPPGPAQLPEPALLRDPMVLARLAVNDLEAPVFRRHPSLRDLRDSLAAAGALISVLCGSGSCVAGLFAGEPERDRAAESFVGARGVRTIRTATLS